MGAGNKTKGAVEMAQRVKTLVAKPKDLSSFPRTCTVGRGNQLLTSTQASVKPTYSSSGWD